MSENVQLNETREQLLYRYYCVIRMWHRAANGEQPNAIREFSNTRLSRVDLNTIKEQSVSFPWHRSIIILLSTAGFASSNSQYLEHGMSFQAENSVASTFNFV